MLNDTFAGLFERDLSKLEQEIRLYPDEASLWKRSGTIMNPGGNLCLHLCGNLQQYIGKILGGSGYVRDREREFAASNIPRHDLLQEIDRTRSVILPVLKSLDAKTLEAPYPEEVLGYPMTTVYFLVHLSHHLGYHTGQINYHRRLFNC